MKLTDYRKINNPLAHCAIRIGIDAGQHTGIAIYGHENDEWIFKTLDFWAAYDYLKRYDVDYTGIVIEVPARFMYRRNDGNQGEKVKMNMSSRMGGNRKEAELLAERFEDMGFVVVRVTPTRKKWNAKDLERETGIKVRTNEHVRDAIRLVWNYI